MIHLGMIAGSQDIPTNEIKLCVFFDRTLLEEMTSPYQHGEFPYVPMVYHHYGVGDTPAGFVRAMKDPQRELNKRRIQTLHLLNTSANGGGWIEDGAMTPAQESEFERKGTLPGHFQKVMAGALSGQKIREREPSNPPTAVIQAEQAATEDLKAISGINESLLGVPSQAGGRAIELRQKQAVTHLAVIFDSLRRAKKKIANLLRGRRGHAGIVPQFYTAEKVYRVEGENGQTFITINEQVAVQDPIAGTIFKTLNDLSQGEFDVVVSDVESSTTQRQAQMWSLVDAASKLAIPHEAIFETLIDLSDLPKKNDIKTRWQRQQQSQQEQLQQQQQFQLELERMKNADFRMQIAFKDAPLPIQMAMAAQAGIIPREIADHFLQVMVEQMAPQLAMQMQKAQVPQNQPQIPMPQQNQMPYNLMEQNQAQTAVPLAAQSAMTGIAPAQI